MALAAAGEAASLAWQLRGVAALGGVIGLGHLAGDMEVGALGLQAAAATPAVLAGLGGLYAGGKYIKGRISDKDVNNEMLPGMKYKRRRDGTVSRIGDPASYRQLTTVKRKFGRKVRALTRNMRLLKTVTEPIRFRFGRVQDVNAANGSYWLTNQPLDVNQRVLPLYLMPLFNIRNPGSASGNTQQAGRAMYELGHDTNGFFWRNVNGTNPLSTGAITNTVQPVSPTNVSTDQVGRKGLCDWTRIRLCIWGKTQNPTQVRVSLVKFLDEEFCPETYDTKGIGPTTGYVNSKCAEYLTNKVKYLLNGHMGAYGRVDRQKYVRTIKQWVVNINPIDAGAETAASDPRAHMKHLDIFNRWNRVCDYTVREGIVQSYTDMIDVNKANAAVTGFGGYLKNPEKNIYLMVESVQPVDEGVGSASTSNPRVAPVAGNIPLAASFDYLFESNFTIVKE